MPANLFQPELKHDDDWRHSSWYTVPLPRHDINTTRPSVSWTRQRDSCSPWNHVTSWHVTSALRELHCLPIRQRIEFKLPLLVHKTLISHTRDYISDLLTPVVDMPSWSSSRASSCGNFVIPCTGGPAIRRPRVLCRCTPRVESATDGTETRSLVDKTTLRHHIERHYY